MDPADLHNLVVLGVFGGVLVAVFVGYFLAWRSKRTSSRKAGALMAAAAIGFSGLVMTAWLLAAVSPFPPPDGTPIWEPLVFLLVFSLLPFAAFYLCAKFIRRALH